MELSMVQTIGSLKWFDKEITTPCGEEAIKGSLSSPCGDDKRKTMKDAYKANIIKQHIEATKNDEYYFAQVTG